MLPTQMWVGNSVDGQRDAYIHSLESVLSPHNPPIYSGKDGKIV